MPELFETTKWLYDRTDDNKARFVLGEHGTRPLICIGVNPSTAEPDKLDPTLAGVKRWSKRLGYDGWIMLNLYPQRSTDPNGMDKECNSALVLDNIIFSTHIAKQYKNATVWVAWGTLIEKRQYLIRCASLMYEVLKHHEWISIGPISVKGHPHHPLYLPRKSEVKPFDLKAYLKKLKG